PYKISVNVSSVVLHATVENHQGAPVSGLEKDDFQVYEDGVLQPIEYYSHEDIPVTVGLVLDNSGSMGPKRDEVIAAALAFARSSNPQDQMFVVNFNEHVSFGLPANTPFTDQTAQLKVALSRFKTNGETALYDALAVALEHLKKGNRDKKVLIVVSDGGDNASQHKLGQILALAGHSTACFITSSRPGGSGPCARCEFWHRWPGGLTVGANRDQLHRPCGDDHGRRRCKNIATRGRAYSRHPAAGSTRQHRAGGTSGHVLSRSTQYSQGR